MNTLFSNASILQPDGGTSLGCVGVQGNTILFAGEMIPDFVAHRTIDCHQNLLLPGLVNTHTHLPMVLFRSLADDLDLHTWLTTKIFPYEEKLNAQDVYWATLLALAEMMRGGTTCVNDMYFFEDAIADALQDSGMRGLIARTVVKDDDDGAKKLNEAIDLFKQYHGSAEDRIHVAFSAHAEYSTNVATLKAVGETAQKYNTKFHIHISETYDEHQQCKDRHRGHTPVSLLESLSLLNKNALLAHCVHVETADIALLAARKAWVLHNPQSNLKLGSGIAPVPVMLSMNANVSLGTDGASSNNNLDMFEEMRLAATLHKGMTNNATTIGAAQALEMATINGAKALGFNAGALQSGKLADIIMLDLQALHMQPKNNTLANTVYSAMSSDVMLNMVNGTILYENGEFYGLDIDRIITEVEKIMNKFA